MKHVNYYETNDGEQFNDRNRAELHEYENAKRKAFGELIGEYHSIKTFEDFDVMNKKYTARIAELMTSPGAEG